MNKVEEKVALITGASSGIGYATAVYLRDKGWKVYGLSRSGKVPEGIHPLVADIVDRAQLEAAFSDLWTAEHRLDAVINSAGIGGAGPIEYIPMEEARKVMETNYFGSLQVAQVCLPYLRQQDRASLVFVSSIAGLIGVPFHGAYSASKFAVEALVEAVRIELTGSNVRAVSVCPGDTKTGIIGNQYRAKAADLPDFYQETYHRADTRMRSSVSDGIPPVQVSMAIYRAIQQDHPRVRFIVGDALQRSANMIKRLTPSKAWEVIVRWYFGLLSR